MESETNDTYDRTVDTVLLNMALSCVFCNVACTLCRDFIVKGFDPEDAILSSAFTEIGHGVDSWFFPTSSMCVSAVLHFAANAFPADSCVRRSMIDPRSGATDYGRLLEKLFDKSVAEHKSPYSRNRIYENAAFISSMDTIADGSVMDAVRDYLRHLMATGDRHLAVVDGDTLSYRKMYRAGRAKLLNDILEMVKELYGPLSKYADEIKDGKREADIADVEAKAMDRAVDMTFEYMNKVGSGCGSLVEMSVGWLSSARGSTGALQTAREGLGRIMSVSAGDGGTEDHCAAQDGSLKKFIDSTWSYIQSMSDLLRRM